MPADCQDDEMVCDVSRCVGLSKRCDGISDCLDDADERDCGGECFYFISDNIIPMYLRSKGALCTKDFNRKHIMKGC